MNSYTYATLTEALQSWPEESASEYLAIVPQLIAKGEDRLIVDLNLEIFDQTNSAIVVTGNNRLVPKPANLITTRSLWILANGELEQLLLRSRDFCTNFAPNPAILRTPRYYCEYSDTYWMVVNTPDQSTTATAIFVQRPAGLSESVTTTWMSTYCGDLLLCTCLMEAEHWIKADDRYADMHEKYYKELLPVRRTEMQNMIRTGQYDPYRPVAQKAG